MTNSETKRVRSSSNERRTSSPPHGILPLLRPLHSQDEIHLARYTSDSSAYLRMDEGEVCPMVTRLHVAHTSDSPPPILTRKRRTQSLGCHQESVAIRSYHERMQELEPLASQDTTPTDEETPLSSFQQAESISDDASTTNLDSGNPIWISVLYGLINAAIVLPVLMSFGSIIYRDEVFKPYMPVLIKLTVVSGMVHQVCFSTFSSLPFAVGQVQDAGLIFLSSMATSMASYCDNQGHGDEALLATVTIGLGIATALLGFGLVIIGRLGLAKYVQMLPTCVIGGYLAFIGWFCGFSGLELMAGSGDFTLTTFLDNIEFVLPGIMGGILIYVLVRRLRHMAVLPTTIIAILMTFYAVLFLTKSSVEEATDAGWIPKVPPAPVWYHTWDYFKFDKVVWMALPSQILTLLSMIFVVALSSSLDVAAIELELNQPLNYNHELKTVGISNIVSGLTGGYTGSYIFSQSIFSLRAGIRSRLAGYVLAFCELLVILLPFPILAYIPSFFFGSLLVMICIDLMHEWLWDVRTKISPAEYVICLATFILIQFIGVEYGIIVGVILYLICLKLGVDVGEVKGAETIEQAESNREKGVEVTASPALAYGSTGS